MTQLTNIIKELRKEIEQETLARVYLTLHGKKVTQKALATEFGLTQGRISQIVTEYRHKPAVVKGVSVVSPEDEI